MSTTTQRPTPETDAAFSSTQGRSYIDIAHEAIDFARKLERERDEARTQADNYAKQLETMLEAIKEAHEALMLAPYRDQEALAKLQPFLKP